MKRTLCKLAVLALVCMPLGATTGLTASAGGSVQKSRAPASVAIPKARSAEDPFRSFRVPMLSAPKDAPRWRLMGTCRQDVGMFQSHNGFGYGNCAN